MKFYLGLVLSLLAMHANGAAEFSLKYEAVKKGPYGFSTVHSPQIEVEGVSYPIRYLVPLRTYPYQFVASELVCKMLGLGDVAEVRTEDAPEGTRLAKITPHYGDSFDPGNSSSYTVALNPTDDIESVLTHVECQNPQVTDLKPSQDYRTKIENADGTVTLQEPMLMLAGRPLRFRMSPISEQDEPNMFKTYRHGLCRWFGYGRFVSYTGDKNGTAENSRFLLWAYDFPGNGFWVMGSPVTPNEDFLTSLTCAEKLQ